MKKFISILVISLFMFNLSNTNTGEANATETNKSKIQENYIFYDIEMLHSVKTKNQCYGVYLIFVDHAENFILKNFNMVLLSPKKEYKKKKEFYHSFHNKIRNVQVTINGMNPYKLTNVSPGIYNVKTMNNLHSGQLLIIQFQAKIHNLPENTPIKAGIGTVVFQNKYNPLVSVKTYRNKKLGWN